MIKHPKLGEMLVDAGLVDRAHLEETIAAQGKNPLKLGRLLMSQGLVHEEQIVELLSRQLKVNRFEPDAYPPDPALSGLFPAEVAMRYGVVPLCRQNHTLYLGMADPTDIDAFDTVEQLTQCEVVPVICTSRELNQLTNSLYGRFAGLNGLADAVQEEGRTSLTTEMDDLPEEVEVGSLVNLAEEAPVVRMVNWILSQAVREGASDIHISPEDDRIQLRYRIDGKLHEMSAPPKSLHLSMVSRIKILSRMDIATSRIPQDGRFTVRLDNRDINVRVSTMPTTHGENVVMRLLDMGAFSYTLNDLGMCDHDRDLLASVLHRPYGMLLSTGPTGSGKTTTLYAMLKELNQPDIHIITVEDPVEYRVPKIRQVQLNTKAGMTFASALRSILRQDPDVIMVGEMRDAETARIAVQAALTGHRVFSTVHTNDAAGAITRMMDMGIEPFLLSSVLLLSFAQRLLRKVCPYCGVRTEATPSALEFWGLPQGEGITFMEPRGCGRCLHSGYQGRIGVFEVLLVDDAIRELIANRATTLDINRAARASGRLRTLKEDAVDKLRQGVTTPEEAMSVISGG